MFDIQNLAVIFIPIFVGLIAQIVKFILYSIKNGLQWNYILTHGHMPSTHSAFAVSLIATVGYSDGIHSSSFIIALALGVLILDDALRLRMYLGDQGRYLNMLISNLKLDPKKYPKLKEHVGHRASEVIVGAIFGLILTLIFLRYLA